MQPTSRRRRATTAGCGASLAALRHERVVQRDAVHRPRPDQQRVGRVRGALIAVPAALHDQPQVVLAREVDGRRRRRRRPRGDGIDAGRDVQASTQPRVCVSATSSPIVQGFFRRAEESGAGGADRRGAAGVERRAHRDQRPPSGVSSCSHWAAAGQAASPGRTRRNGWAWAGMDISGRPPASIDQGASQAWRAPSTDGPASIRQTLDFAEECDDRRAPWDDRQPPQDERRLGTSLDRAHPCALMIKRIHMRV